MRDCHQLLAQKLQPQLFGGENSGFQRWKPWKIKDDGCLGRLKSLKNVVFTRKRPDEMAVGHCRVMQVMLDAKISPLDVVKKTWNSLLLWLNAFLAAFPETKQILNKPFCQVLEDPHGFLTIFFDLRSSDR